MKIRRLVNEIVHTFIALCLYNVTRVKQFFVVVLVSMVRTKRTDRIFAFSWTLDSRMGRKIFF